MGVSKRLHTEQVLHGGQTSQRQRLGELRRERHARQEARAERQAAASAAPEPLAETGAERMATRVIPVAMARETWAQLDRALARAHDQGRTSPAELVGVFVGVGLMRSWLISPEMAEGRGQPGDRSSGSQ